MATTAMERVETRFPVCFPHSEVSPERLLSLVKEHSRDYRTIDGLATWTPAPGTRRPHGDDGDDAGHTYAVLGWTTTSILRGTLSQRLDSLNPVAAFRLLDQPEIAQLERSNRDYVVLVDTDRRTEDAAVAGAISARDIDLWCTSDATELAGAFAVDAQTYWHHFAGTGVAA